MTDIILAGTPQSEIELRAQIQPIDELLDQRRHLIEKVADLRAKYGSFGTFDHLRKMELARIKALLRAQYTNAKVKVSNDLLDDEAHAHADYFDFITTATKQRAEWVKLEAKVEEIDHKIYRGNGLLKFASSEFRS